MSVLKENVSWFEEEMTYCRHTYSVGSLVSITFLLISPGGSYLAHRSPTVIWV